MEALLFPGLRRPGKKIASIKHIFLREILKFKIKIPSDGSTSFSSPSEAWKKKCFHWQKASSCHNVILFNDSLNRYNWSYAVWKVLLLESNSYNFETLVKYKPWLFVKSSIHLLKFSSAVGVQKVQNKSLMKIAMKWI